jgi:mono/diheme cytochrome c family protein
MSLASRDLLQTTHTNPKRQRGSRFRPRLRFGLVSATLLLCLMTTACQQEMARQPSYRPLEQSDFFYDGRASRTLVAGTVPWRGGQRAEPSLLTYRRGPRHIDAARLVAVVGTALNNPVAAAPLTLTAEPAVSDYVTVCPIAIDKEALLRGQERFNIYCAVCHDALGTGNGKIVERGYLRPPDYHRDYSRGFERRGQKVLLREAPIGYFFEVVTLGYGGMPDYASQIPPDDRWKIVAYIRVLQRSQWVELAKLPAAQREAIQSHLPPLEKQR